MPNDSLSCAYAHKFIVASLHEGACFFVCLLSALLAALFALQTLCSTRVNMLNIHPNGIVTMCTCSHDIIKISRTTVTLILVASTFILKW